jgi:GNAT superfamily N-acetyltransferase
MDLISKLKFSPLTPERWDDFQTLFGERGACAGCWCLFWRLPAAQWNAQKGGPNRKAMRNLVRTGPPPGLLAYHASQPVGWCAVGPRADFVRLANSRVLRPVDDQPVWSVTCFFVAKPFRRQGVSVALLEAAARFAKKNGAKILEGYPTETKKRQADVFVYTGLASAFRQAGFEEAARRSPTRPVFRRRIAA